MVVSMLRTLLGDAKFFQACRDYLNDPLLSYKAATTADAERNFENQFGADMSHYFNAWIYGAGTPSYTVNWATTGNNITVQLTQTRTAGATVTYFPMPVVLRAANTGNTSNTTLVFYDRGDSVFVAGNGITLASGVAGNTISVNLAFAPATLTFDPDNVTMATGTTTKVTSLKQAAPFATEVVTDKAVIYPNPADKEIILHRATATAGTVTITDMNGKIVLRRSVNNRSEKINTSQLAPGNYIVQVTENGLLTHTVKVVVQH